MRIRLFEFEDFKWVTNSIRDAGTDILRFMWEVGWVYRPIVPIFLIPEWCMSGCCAIRKRC